MESETKNTEVNAKLLARIENYKLDKTLLEVEDPCQTSMFPWSSLSGAEKSNYYKAVSVHGKATMIAADLLARVGVWHYMFVDFFDNVLHNLGFRQSGFDEGIPISKIPLKIGETVWYGHTQSTKRNIRTNWSNDFDIIATDIAKESLKSWQPALPLKTYDMLERLAANYLEGYIDYQYGEHDSFDEERLRKLFMRCCITSKALDSILQGSKKRDASPTRK